MEENKTEHLSDESKVSSISIEELAQVKGKSSSAGKKSWEELFIKLNEEDEKDYQAAKKSKKGSKIVSENEIKNEGNNKVQSISAEELAAAMAENSPVVNENKEETGSSNVSSISAEELAAAKSDVNSEQDIDSVDEKSDESMSESVEEAEESALLSDDELLSKLDEETRREYEYLAKKYSYNPIAAQNKTDIVADGEYDERFDFEKHTDIKKVSLLGKKRPFIIAGVCAALLIIILVPILVVVLNKPKVEPVVLTGVSINQKDIYAYTNSYVDLRNVYMTATYSDGSSKIIPCNTGNMTSRPGFVNGGLYLADTTATDGKMSFAYEGRSVELVLKVCKVSYDGVSAEIFGTSSIVAGEVYSYENIYLTKNYSATNVVDNCGTADTSDDYERIPGEYSKILDAADYNRLSVSIKKAGEEAGEAISWNTLIASGGLVFDEAGTYSIIFSLDGKTIETVSFQVQAPPPAEEPPVEEPPVSE